MTREERLDWLCRLRSGIYVYMPYEWLKPIAEALTDSIKALELEPKTGHWIEVIDRTDRFGNKSAWHYRCSICGDEDSSCGEFKFCPKCGSKMKEY